MSGNRNYRRQPVAPDFYPPELQALERSIIKLFVEVENIRTTLPGKDPRFLGMLAMKSYLEEVMRKMEDFQRVHGAAP
jgi:hypothetical protein